MGRKRKYEEVKGWWVYTIFVPSIQKYYIGISKRQCCDRWNKATYKNTVLKEYLDEWDSIIKTVLVDGLTKEQAYQYEDNIIRALQMNNLCINERRSGLITSDKNAYQREYYKNNSEFQEYVRENNKQWREDNKDKKQEYDKKYREDNKERIKQRNKQYRENNKEKIYQQQKQYRENNKEKENQRKKQWRENNREKYREYQKQYRLKKKLKKQQNQLTLFDIAS